MGRFLSISINYFFLKKKLFINFSLKATFFFFFFEKHYKPCIMPSKFIYLSKSHLIINPWVLSPNPTSMIIALVNSFPITQFLTCHHSFFVQRYLSQLLNSSMRKISKIKLKKKKTLYTERFFFFFALASLTLSSNSYLLSNQRFKPNFSYKKKIKIKNPIIIFITCNNLILKKIHT